MFYLPVFVNQSRFHYCKLQPTGAEFEQVEFGFVVKRESGHSTELIRFRDGSKFISTAGTKHDIDIELERLSCQTVYRAGSPHELELSITPKEKGPAELKELNAGLSGSDLRWSIAEDELYLSYEGLRSGTIRVKIVLDPGSGKTYHASFLLHLGPARTIFDAVFDFGSEASQIAVHQRGTEPSSEPRLNLFDIMLFDFYAPALKSGRLGREPAGPDGAGITISNADRERFMAYDHAPFQRSNIELYNSSFFVLRSHGCGGDKRNADLHTRPFEEGDHEWVSLMGDTYDDRYMSPETDRDYEIVPNLKLAELRISRDFALCYNGRNLRFSKDFVQKSVFRRVLVQFLHLLMHEIENDHPDEKEKLLKLTLLVPNIYSQQRVSELIKALYESLRTIIHEQEYGFAGVEVQTLSESDAALLGLVTDSGIEGIDHNTFSKGDHCLVIDSGKGTTDISVLVAGAERRYSSIFRSGFAGAGNALTYAFADTLFAAMAGPENIPERQNHLSQFMGEDKDLANRYLFAKALESVKRNYGKRNEPGYAMDYPDFKRRFEGLHPADKRSMILEIVQDEFAKKGKTFKDYFGIVEATIDMLVKRTVELVEKSRQTNFAAVVLSGRSFLMEEYRNRLEKALREKFNIGKVVFQPHNLKKSCLLGPLNHPHGTNLNSDLVGTPVISQGPPQAMKLLNMFRRSKDNPARRHSATRLHEEDFFLDGEVFDPTKQTVSICGKDLVAPSMSTEEYLTLSFVGEKFILRNETTCDDAGFGHSTGATVETDPLAWMSQFPHMSLPGHITPVKRTPDEQIATPVAQPVAEEEQGNAAGRQSPYPDDDMWDHI